MKLFKTIVGAVALLALVVFGYRVLIEKPQNAKDKAEIARLATDIAAAEKSISDSKVKENAALAEAAEAKGFADSMVLARDKALEIAAAAEKRAKEAEASVAAMPTTQVVQDTQAILACTEIVETERGILFSEPCSRKNLTKLIQGGQNAGALFSIKEALTKETTRADNLDRSLTSMTNAWSECTTQVIDKDRIIADVNAKLAVVTRASNRKRNKALLIGLGVGIVVGFVAGK